MSWTLETPEGTCLRVNAWTWRPTLELLEGVIDEETLGMLGFNNGFPVTGEEAARIAGFLDRFLANLPHDGRVRLDGEITTEPDTYAFHRDDLALNYAASADWLRAFRDFCRAAPRGFVCR